MTNWPPALAYLTALAVGYLLGSIPFGLLVTRLAGTGDIRAIGSGSIGATNVLRTGRKALAAATLLGDALKGTAAVVLCRALLGEDAALMAGAAALLGHIFPVWLGFKGGKGIATYIGLLIAFAWPAAIVFGLIWFAVAWASRYSSLAGLTASGLMPVVLWFLDDHRLVLLFVCLTALVWVMHRGNIARLIAGTEPKIGQKATAPGQ
jgi:glycerol-3-phosphate acyltransferase PlsY